MSSSDVKTIGRNLRQVSDPSTRRFLERIMENIDILKEATGLLEGPPALQWRDAVLQNSWVRFSTSFNPPQFTLTSDGFVMLRGVIASGTTTAGTVLFSLPEGYRPEYQVRFEAEASTGHSGFDVQTDGDVIIQTGGNVYFSLDYKTFQAFR